MHQRSERRWESRAGRHSEGFLNGADPGLPDFDLPGSNPADHSASPWAGR